MVQLTTKVITVYPSGVVQQRCEKVAQLRQSQHLSPVKTCCQNFEHELLFRWLFRASFENLQSYYEDLQPATLKAGSIFI